LDDEDTTARIECWGAISLVVLDVVVPVDENAHEDEDKDEYKYECGYKGGDRDRDDTEEMKQHGDDIDWDRMP